jgi:two-component sensor histidine kinase
VADNGVGLPDTFSPALSDSFGTQLIVNLSKQLGGRAEFGSLQENGGTRWNIRFPFDPHTPDKRSRIDTKSALL